MIRKIYAFSFVLLAFILSQNAYAQSFNLRILSEGTGGGFLYVTVQIKANSSMFKLGSSELYLDYNPATLGPPMIEQMYNYTGLVTDSALCPTGFCPYALTPTLSNSNGRSGVFISLAFAGVGAFVPMTPTNLMKLKFPILDASGDMNMQWRMPSEVIAPTKIRLDDETTSLPGNNLSGLTGPVPLPVEVIDFSAIAEDRSIRISWSTAFEYNSKGISLEKSMDALNFEEVSWFPSEGNTAEPVHYSFTDQNADPGQIYYYRLKQVDLNGITQFSSILEINLPLDRTLVGELAYAQAGKDIFLPIGLHKDIPFHIQLLDATGREVNKKTHRPGNGEHLIELSTSQLATGIFYVRIIANGKVFVRKGLMH